jgi:ABC-type multidrug transport system fused ATPase/permease subunit
MSDDMMKKPPPGAGGDMMKKPPPGAGGDMMKKPGGAPAGFAKGEAVMPTDAKVPYAKLFRWGWVIVRAAFIPFLLTTFLTVFNQTLLQFNLQLVAAVVGHLKSPSAETAEPKHATDESTIGPKPEKKKAPPPHGEVGGAFAKLIPQSTTSAFELLAVLAILAIFLSLTERLLTQWSDNVMLARLQQRLHDKLLTLGPGYHIANDVGVTTLVVSRFSTGAQLLLRDLISFPVVRGIGLITALVFLFNALASIGSTPVALKLVLLAVLLFLPVIGVNLARRLRKAFAKVRDSELALSEELQNSLSMPLEVQLMGALPQRSAAFEAKLRTHVRNKVAASLRNETSSQAQSAIPAMLQLGFLGYGVWLASTLDDPAAVAGATGALIAIYQFVPTAVSPLQQIIQFFNGLNSAWAQVEKVVDILEAEPEVKAPTSPEPIPDGPQPVALDDVTFSYRAGLKPVLDGVTLSFEPGKVTALVGAAGSGKSTIFNLIARLSDPQKGTVAIGGVDVRRVATAELRRRVVRVAQFPLFVAGTVRENFLLAKADATDAEIEDVAKKTGFWDVLLRVSPKDPLGYVLPRNVAQGLSGG